MCGGSGDLTRLELVVDGRVVRRACGDGGTVLKWSSWDLAELMGQSAVLCAVDEDTHGHLCLGHVVLTDAPVPPTPMADITRWADHGRDFYAPITFSNLRDDRVVWLGWMSNWDYAREVPTHPWRGQQSLARQLDLVSTPRGLRLRQRVVQEMQACVAPDPVVRVVQADAQTAAEALAAKAPSGRYWRSRLVVAADGLSEPIGLELFKGMNEAVRVGFDPATGSFFIDRVARRAAFAGYTERHIAQRLRDDPQISMEIWTDGSTVELFADGGIVVISDLVYSGADATAVTLFHGAENPKVETLELHRLTTELNAKQDNPCF